VLVAGDADALSTTGAEIVANASLSVKPPTASVTAAAGGPVGAAEGADTHASGSRAHVIAAIDASLVGNSVAVLAPFTAGDNRVSCFFVYHLNLEVQLVMAAVLALWSGAAAAGDVAYAGGRTVLTMGALLFLATSLVVLQPLRPESSWYLPVQVHSLVAASLNALLAGALLGQADTASPAGAIGLSYLAFAATASLALTLVLCFLMSLWVGAQVESKVDVSNLISLGNWRAARNSMRALITGVTAAQMQREHDRRVSEEAAAAAGVGAAAMLASETEPARGRHGQALAAPESAAEAGVSNPLAVQLRQPFNLFARRADAAGAGASGSTRTALGIGLGSGTARTAQVQRVLTNGVLDERVAFNAMRRQTMRVRTGTAAASASARGAGGVGGKRAPVHRLNQ
jgi:hypothetical protein